MFVENSPFSQPTPPLKRVDITVFFETLAAIVLDQIPTSEQIRIVTPEAIKAHASELPDRQKTALVRKVFAQKIPTFLEPDKLILPFRNFETEDFALLVEGVDGMVVDRASKQWLKETSLTIFDKFADTRNLYLDPLTSLLNINGFKHYQASVCGEKEIHLMLVESQPPAKSVRDAFTHLAETARLLETFNRFAFPLFTLGQSVFALVVPDRDKEFVKALSLSLTNFARNSGLRRIRIGFSSSSPRGKGKRSAAVAAKALTDEAWIALKQAGRRGPYAFCDYELLKNPEIFPLGSVTRSTGGKLSYRCKNLESFSLVYLKPDFNERRTFDKFIDDYVAGELFIADTEGYFVILPIREAGKARNWASSLIEKIIAEKGEQFSISAGVGCYPFHGYKKSEIAKNCMKALLHGSFFGPGSCVVFDSLSLNVSGDAYFTESDLFGAVREYRKGLELAPRDINLLNSLGVAYGLMNRTGKAIETFNEVLDIDADNFMALYNRGLGEKKLNRHEEAVGSLNRAIEAHNPEADEETGSLSELQFQLGLSLYEIGDYRQCVAVLERWYKEQNKQKGGERCFRYIGISYYHLAELTLAATWLQRSLAVHQSDAESLSLLGSIYLKTGEGDDIALKLCEKGAELEPQNPEFKIRYGQALASCNKINDALEVYKSCTRLRDYRSKAWLGMARAFYQTGRDVECKSYLNKIFSSGESNAGVVKQAKKIQKRLQGK